MAAENRILRVKIKGRLQLSDGEKHTLAEIAHRLGRKALAEVAVVARPDTILGWFRKLVARKFDGSQFRQSVGRPRIEKTIEDLIVRIAQENPSWGYDRIEGALANLGHTVSDQTIGNILKRHGIAPAPKRKHTTRWRDFVRAHMNVLAGCDFFTVEVLTLKGLVTYYVLFFIQLETRRVCLAGITQHPDQQWMEQQARNVTMKDWGFLARSRYLLHDRDGKFCPLFRQTIRAGKLRPLKLPARSPNLNAFAERWVCSVKEECVSRLVFFGEHSLRRALAEYVAHYQGERNHQGKGNKLLFPLPRGGPARRQREAIHRKKRLGGLLKYYERQPA
ncbi:MAG: IS3 family transposase [Acidobacteriales bacterium]|nr:IS3 family transposase [Terriglobales bacterium]